MSTLPSDSGSSEGPLLMTIQELRDSYPMAELHLNSACGFSQAKRKDGNRLLLVKNEDGTVSAYGFPDKFSNLEDNESCGLALIGELALIGQLPDDPKVKEVGEAMLTARRLYGQISEMRKPLKAIVKEMDLDIKRTASQLVHSMGLASKLSTLIIGEDLTLSGVQILIRFSYFGPEPTTETIRKSVEAVESRMGMVMNRLFDAMMPGASRQVFYTVDSSSPFVIRWKANAMVDETLLQQLAEAVEHLTKLLPSVFEEDMSNLLGSMDMEGFLNLLGLLLNITDND